MNLIEKVKKINSAISKEDWLDMEVLEMRGGNLVIIGSTDFTYGHSLEIVFEDVFHVSINTEWRIDTSRLVLYIIDGEECLSVNRNYKIERGNVLFKIIPEDLDVPFYVSARNVEFNTDSVLYYKKDNLGENERIADWVQ